VTLRDVVPGAVLLSKARGIFLLTVAALFLAACEGLSGPGAKGVGGLPVPAGEAARFSNYQPHNAYSQLASGILTRTLYKTSSGRGYSVEVRDLLVGPRLHSAAVSLPGAAIFEIQSGSGAIALRDGSRQFKVGSAFSVPEHKAFTIKNEGDAAIAIRVHLFWAE
jgi:mannose-6-phosphate isomerase-like protein (cupin superfamily)